MTSLVPEEAARFSAHRIGIGALSASRKAPRLPADSLSQLAASEAPADEKAQSASATIVGGQDASIKEREPCVPGQGVAGDHLDHHLGGLDTDWWTRIISALLGKDHNGRGDFLTTAGARCGGPPI
jgi:hypothetical protein